MGSSFELSRDEMMILCEVKMYLMREKGGCILVYYEKCNKKNDGFKYYCYFCCHVNYSDNDVCMYGTVNRGKSNINSVIDLRFK